MRHPSSRAVSVSCASSWALREIPWLGSGASLENHNSVLLISLLLSHSLSNLLSVSLEDDLPKFTRFQIMIVRRRSGWREPENLVGMLLKYGSVQKGGLSGHRRFLNSLGILLNVVRID